PVCKVVYAHYLHADSFRYTLTFLASRAHPCIQCQDVADHANPAHGLGAAADQCGALDGVGDAAVLDHVGLGGRENELAAGDVHLAATEIDGIEATIHRGNDVLGIVAAGQHVGVGHARHGQMGIG